MTLQQKGGWKMKSGRLMTVVLSVGAVAFLLAMTERVSAAEPVKAKTLVYRQVHSSTDTEQGGAKTQLVGWGWGHHHHHGYSFGYGRPWGGGYYGYSYYRPHYYGYGSYYRPYSYGYYPYSYGYSSYYPSYGYYGSSYYPYSNYYGYGYHCH
jgi:hypothetical protein